MHSGSYVEQLGRLEFQARQLARRLRPAQDRDARYAGVDDSRVVEIVVDGDGRFQDVAIHSSWRDYVPPGELGMSVQQAWKAANTARLAAWAEAVADQRQPEQPLPPLPSFPDLEEVRQLVDRLVGDADQVSGRERVEKFADRVREHARAGVARTYEGISLGGHAAVVMNAAGELVSVEYDRRWLAGTEVRHILRETKQAFDGAVAQLPTDPVAALLADGPLRELGSWLARLSQWPDPAAARRPGGSQAGRRVR